MKPTMDRLRGTFPEWTWRYGRAGFGGSKYTGRYGQRSVTIYRCAIATDQSADDYRSIWMAEENGQATAFAIWAAANAVKP